MDPFEIIKKYFAPGTLAFEILIEHSTAVMEKALLIADGLRDLEPDRNFIREASLLHDIGIVFVHEPRFGCFGAHPYICHGYLGRELLEKEGYPEHALVCERHVGTGLGIADIEKQGLPLPLRDMQPLSLEEKIICYADKFFSKRPGNMRDEKPLGQVRADMDKYGAERLRAFDEMHEIFSKRPSQETARLPEL